MGFTHLDDEGRARMVDVSGKEMVRRTAVAAGTIRMAPTTLEAVRAKEVAKGDVLTVAKIAAVMAAKRTADLIPLCHTLRLDHADAEFEILADGIRITTRVVCVDRTGAEMEALNAVCAAALTIYDMCKAVDKGMRITDVHLVEKTKEAR